MPASNAIISTPDGGRFFGPVDPRTWVAGDRARAKWLASDVAAGVAWHRDRPFFQGLQTLAQSIPASTWTAIKQDYEVVDRLRGHSDSTNTDRWFAPFTVNNSDFYLCSGYVPLSGSDTTKVAIAGIMLNSAIYGEGTKVPYGSGHALDVMAIDLVEVPVFGTLSLGTWTNIAGGSTTVISGKSPSLTVRWVGSGTGTVSPLPSVPRTWIPADQLSASSTGASTAAGGTKVPLNTELRDVLRFLNYPPLARITAQGGSQTIPTSGSWTSINFTTGSNIDTYSGWSSGTPSKYTVQRAGVYFVAGYVSVAEVSAAGGYRAVRLLVNGSTPYGGNSAVPMTSGTTGTGLYAVRRLRLAAGDTVEVQMSQTGSSALTVGSGSTNAARLIMVWQSR